MKFNKYITEGVTPTTKITITARDPDGSLVRMLNFIKERSDPGHSFSALVDREGDGEQSFGFDGDGMFSIVNIKEQSL